MQPALTDASTWRNYGEQELSKPLAAALDAFFEHGYHGTTIRDVALRTELSVPGLYHYYASKQALLVGLIDAVMDELLERSKMALKEADGDHLKEFDFLIENLLRFHMFRRKQAFVAATEIRSLDEPNRKAYISRRDEMEAMVLDVVERGRASGHFKTEYPHETSRVLLTMCVGVASWYRPDGPLTPDELVDRYVTFARDLVRMSSRRRRTA